MPAVSLRAAMPEDGAFLYKLYALTRHEEVSSWGWSVEQAEAFLHMQWLAQQSSYSMQFPNAVRSIILLEQEPVGQCYVNESIDELRLIDISVMPDCRNKGIGSSVIKELQQKATQRCIPVILSVSPGNPALRLYERLGFILNEATDMYLFMSWQPSTIISFREGKADE